MHRWSFWSKLMGGFLAAFVVRPLIAYLWQWTCTVMIINKQEFCVTLALNKFKYTVGRPLYSSEHYSKTNNLSENRHLDICVAGRLARAVVVVSTEGKCCLIPNEIYTYLHKKIFITSISNWNFQKNLKTKYVLTFS